MLTYIIFAIFLINSVFGENYPALIWTTEKDTLLQALAGHTINKIDFRNQYLDNYDNIIVFIRNELDVNEFILSGSVYECNTDTAFYNLKNIMLNHHSTYLPYVEDAYLTIKSVDKIYKRSILDASSNYELQDKDQFRGKNLLFVRLSDDTLSSIEIDKIMGKVNKQLQNMNLKYVAIYTSKYTKEHNDNYLNSIKKVSKRSADSNVKNSSNFLIKDLAFMMKVTEINLDGTNNSVIDLSNAHVTDNNCKPQNLSSVDYNCTLKVNLGDLNATIKDINLVFVFVTSRSANKGFWFIENLKLTYKNASEMITTELDPRFVDMTPLKYSYHCSKHPPVRPIIRSINESANPNLRLTFKEFQLQVFMENNTLFGHYNDCVGFFTIPIWMFIICSIVLLTILYFGISMLMSIMTMDRYDDPKGKTIMVSATD